MQTCGQCGKPAVFDWGGHLLCVDCHLKVQQAIQIRDYALKERENFLLDQADAITGLSGVFPRHQIETPVIHRGPMNFHSIRVDRSVVGAINTGNVKKMEVALNNIHANNENDQLEQALKDFTVAVLHESNLSGDTKNEIVEQLSALAEQLAMPKGSQAIGVIKAFMNNIAAGIVTTGLVSHWDKTPHSHLRSSRSPGFRLRESPR
jgi:hypothetical protein